MAIKILDEFLSIGLSPIELLLVSLDKEYSNKELSKMFNVSEKTISRAYKHLEDNGLLKRQTANTKNGKERKIEFCIGTNSKIQDKDKLKINIPNSWNLLPNKSGIYGIYLDNELVYIGKSKNIKQRCSLHWTNIEGKRQYEYKYELLRKAVEQGQQLSFSVIQLVEEEQLDSVENMYINEYMPKLNTQTPNGNKKIGGI